MFGRKRIEKLERRLQLLEDNPRYSDQEERIDVLMSEVLPYSTHGNVPRLTYDLLPRERRVTRLAADLRTIIRHLAGSRGDCGSLALPKPLCECQLDKIAGEWLDLIKRHCPEVLEAHDATTEPEAPAPAK